MKLIQISNKALAGALLALGLCAAQSALAQWTFTGDYLTVGVGADGSIIDPNTLTGIQYSATGFPAINNDMITPGTPFQMYSIGVGGNYGVASYYGGSSLGASTLNTSSGSTFSTKTTGAYGGLDYTQTLSFAKNSTVINFVTTLQNVSGGTLNNIAYGTGFDPDPDVYQYGSYYTVNNILNQSVVQATGQQTGNTILIQGLTAGGVPSIVPDWPYYDPYGLSGGYAGYSGGGDFTIPSTDNGDYSIYEAWNVGSLGDGQSVTIDYNYIINSTPVTTNSPILGTPDTGSTLALLGLALAGLGAVRRKMMV